MEFDHFIKNIPSNEISKRIQNARQPTFYDNVFSSAELLDLIKFCNQPNVFTKVYRKVHGDVFLFDKNVLHILAHKLNKLNCCNTLKIKNAVFNVGFGLYQPHSDIDLFPNFVYHQALIPLTFKVTDQLLFDKLQRFNFFWVTHQQCFSNFNFMMGSDLPLFNSELEPFLQTRFTLTTQNQYDRVIYNGTKSFDSFDFENVGKYTGLHKNTFYNLSINRKMEWLPGSAIDFDSSFIHGSSDYTKMGISEKSSIILYFEEPKDE